MGFLKEVGGPEECVWPSEIKCKSHGNLQVISVFCFTFGVCNFVIGTTHTSKYADTFVGVNLLGGRKIRRNM